ncbi:MAG: PEP-CTERM sorting domain-containing protein, partial [Chloroflexi bacterium]
SDRTFSDADFAALGGPSAAGILVPEPSAALLLAFGVGGLALSRKRRG